MEILYDEQEEEDVAGLLWGQEPAHANAGMPARAAAAAAMSALCMCPHTALYVSAYCYICVRMLLEPAHANAGGRAEVFVVVLHYVIRQHAYGIRDHTSGLAPLGGVCSRAPLRHTSACIRHT